MGVNSKIGWTDHTWNGWEGCVKVSPACDHCYAETRANHYKSVVWGAEKDGGTRRVASEKVWDDPHKWNREAAREGVRKRVFALSLGDVFEDWRGKMTANNKNPMWWCDGSLSNSEAPPVLQQDCHNAGAMFNYRWATMQDFRERMAQLILDTPALDWLLLTKRPENVVAMWPYPTFPANVWIGTTVENQVQYVRRMPFLLGIPAKLRFLSVEPMLSPINFDFSAIWCRHHKRFEYLCMDESSPCFRWQAQVGDMVDWAIIGGESGHGARPFDVDAAADAVTQCRFAGVVPFVKQLGKLPFRCEGRRVAPAGCNVDPADCRTPGGTCTFKLADGHGVDWDEWPAEIANLKVREFPEPPALVKA